MNEKLLSLSLVALALHAGAPNELLSDITWAAFWTLMSIYQWRTLS